MKTGCIYKITHIPSQKTYIGQTTVSPMKRWSDHYVHANNNSQSKISRAIAKHGIEEFIFQVIETNIPENQLDDKEKYYIKIYDANKTGYNETIGGNNTSIRSKLSQQDVDEIIDMIRDGKKFTEIAKLYSVNVSTISDINCGDSWRNPNITYPIRASIYQHHHFSYDEIDDIYNKLKKGFTASEIGRQYFVSTTTISKINNGKIYARTNETYPIQSSKNKPLNLTENELLNIANLLMNTNDNYITISRKTKIGRKTISGINNGIIYTDILNKNGYTSFPIRLSKN